MKKMKSLIVEDEYTSREMLKHILDEYGDCDIAVNTTEAIEAFKKANEINKPYDLICLDILLPDKDGHEALKIIRSIEKRTGAFLCNPAKIFMTSAMTDIKNVSDAYLGLCDDYLNKPIRKKKLDEILLKYKLIGK